MSQKYQKKIIFEKLVKDPVTGRREWRNNKASACDNGFILDFSVKDEEPTEDSPEPQFIFGAGYARRIVSMDSERMLNFQLCSFFYLWCFKLFYLKVSSTRGQIFGQNLTVIGLSIIFPAGKFTIQE